MPGILEIPSWKSKNTTLNAYLLTNLKRPRFFLNYDFDILQSQSDMTFGIKLKNVLQTMLSEIKQ